MDCPNMPSGWASTTSSASATSPSPSPSLPQTPEPTTVPSSLPPLPPSASEKTKAKRKWSEVWQHFDEFDVMVDDKNNTNKDETKNTRARKKSKCKYCPQEYFTDSGTNGTSQMNKHVKVCPKFPGRIPDKGQTKLSLDRSEQVVSRGATQADCLTSCVEMVIIDELPFSFVEDFANTSSLKKTAPATYC
ncbi:hypothetical protein AQUCO_00100297v1 [Aquilegia coerulea]|uniref:BED-type domain-containing protein n=1 Tax=Aquilegia coerulea TaxID=218851 RepID=A0A2G5F9V9_AQUCA|nr:hypothetical protein AQUCO_00100297v1 [Aquilegia coerulea]